MADEKKNPLEEDGQEPPKIKNQKRLFKKKRAGVVLTENEVKEIKAGRKKIRKELRAAGIKSRKDFETTASSLGLYFDKHRWWTFLLWLFHGKWLWALLGALLLLLLAFFVMSLVTKMRGHFTINMTNDLFREGFAICEEEEFDNPTSYLYSIPLEGAMCVSIANIPKEVLETDGYFHGEDYFAYTFYMRNDGESVVDYDWKVQINSESKNLSKATWVMVFEDEEMMFYAEAKEDGSIEALPAFSDNTRGYLKMPFGEYARYPHEQFEQIDADTTIPYYRVIPISFEDDTTVASGRQTEVKPKDVHKYTVVLWLEGDDPDCTNDLIGGHIGLEMNFNLIKVHEEEEN